MSTSFISLLVIILSVGAFLAAWAGIRSIQSARSIVFYRTRRSQMRAGWQWLATSLVLLLFAVGSIFLKRPVVGQIFSPTFTPNSSPTVTFVLVPSSTFLPTRSPTQAPSPSGTSTAPSTATTLATPSRTPPYLGTYTAFAIWTERKSTFLAMLSFTPTASRTPIPTWTRTPSSTPRPTYTASATRTPRPTWTPSLTSTPVTPRPTWTASPTRTPRPTLTSTATPTRTSTPTRTATPTP